MQVSSLPVTYRERVSESWPLPSGRIVCAEISIANTSPTIKNGAEGRDSLRLTGEVRWPGADEFEAVVATAWLSEPGTYRLELPQAEVIPDETPLAPKAIVRLRVAHEGVRDPVYRVSIHGL